MDDAEGECAEGDVEGEYDDQTLDIPFPFSAVDVALERKYSFDEWIPSSRARATSGLCFQRV
jgi:hypothetical protein